MVLALCLALCANGTDDISLRLSPSFYDEANQTIYVDVELRYRGQGQLNLADQNYRLYYDSEVLSVNEDRSRSDLPQDLYSQLEFMEVLEDLNAGDVNQLSFDDQLGFINFGIDLHSSDDAGISLRKEDDWQRVAVLNFNLNNKKDLSRIVWSQSGATDQYATAFVEIMEWVAPNETKPVNVHTYVDAAFKVNDHLSNVDLTLSPNPTVDFIKLEFDRPLESDMNVLIYDGTGKKVKDSMAYNKSKQVNLAVIDLSPGTYTIDLRPVGTKQIAYSTTFVRIDH